PNRVDLTLSDVTLSAPAAGHGWQAPFVQIFALSYRPHHLIAVWPHAQRLTLAGRAMTLASEDLRASLVVAPAPALPLERARLVGAGLALRAEGAADGVAAEVLRLALDRREDGDYHLGAEVQTLDPGPRLAAAGAAAGLPARLARLRLAAGVTLDRTLDRHAGAEPPRLAGVTIEAAEIAWGALRLSAQGRVAIGPDGRPDGRVEIDIAGWRALPPLAVAAGLIAPARADTFAAMLAVLAGGPDAAPDAPARLPLVFAAGRMSLGPFPLGPAPRLPPPRP
ncbi:MAG: DUF2125 domain-containing protein, partial [Rhodobacteraceae bacterium]|nr:DUF2125 domain-containing protein [Paracoccaceae bacterium]